MSEKSKTSCGRSVTCSKHGAGGQSPEALEPLVVDALSALLALPLSEVLASPLALASLEPLVSDESPDDPPSLAPPFFFESPLLLA